VSAAPTPSWTAPLVEGPAASPLSALQGLSREQLILRWRNTLGGSVPGHLPKHLLVRLLAYRLQAQVEGDLDRATGRALDRLAGDSAAAKAAGRRPQAVQLPETASLKPGTVLVREHEGVLHRVMVLADGFAWQGSTYASLSNVAFAITGTRWNGPRFFGLRDRRSTGVQP
jgi:hypothetical protein